MRDFGVRSFVAMFLVFAACVEVSVHVSGSESDPAVPDDPAAPDASGVDASEAGTDAAVAQCAVGQHAEDGGCVADDTCPLGCSGRGPCTDDVCSCETGDAGVKAASGDGAECTGTCIPGKTTCAVGARAYDICGPDGTPFFRVNCRADDGTADFEVCRTVDGAAECLVSPDMRYGEHDTSDWATTPQVPDEWRIVRVHVPVAVRMVGLAAAFVSAPPTASARLALWTERVGAFGKPQPDVLRWRSGLGNAAVAPFTQLNTSVIDLPAGHYWVGFNVSTELTIPYRNVPGAESVVRELTYSTDPNVTPEWAPFRDTQITSGSQFGIWIVGRPLL